MHANPRNILYRIPFAYACMQTLESEAQDIGLTAVASEILHLHNLLEVLIIADSVSGNDKDDAVNHVLYVVTSIELDALYTRIIDYWLKVNLMDSTPLRFATIVE